MTKDLTKLAPPDNIYYTDNVSQHFKECQTNLSTRGSDGIRTLLDLAGD